MEINFIGNCIRSRESSNAAADEWQYVAMVVGIKFRYSASSDNQILINVKNDKN